MENHELPFIVLAIQVCTHDTISIYTQIARSEENLLTEGKTAHKNQICSEQEFARKICSQQKFAHRICSKHRKTAHNEKPCRLGWIITMARCLASSQSEQGWRAPLNGLSRNGWNVLGRTFQGYALGLCVRIRTVQGGPAKSRFHS
jgi:hypothetical protein